MSNEISSIDKSKEKNSFRQIMKGTSIFGGVQVFNILIAVIRSKAIAILIGPTGIGIVGLLTATIGLITSASNFGLGTSAVKDIAQAHSAGEELHMAKTTAVFRKLVWATGLLGVVLTLGLAPWLSELTFGNRDYTWAFILLSVTLLLGQLTVGQNVILQGTRNLKYLASANMVGSVMSLVISIPLYYFYGLRGIVPALIIISFSAYIIALYYSNKIKIPKVTVSLHEIILIGKGMLKLGFMLSLSGIIGTVVAYLIRIYISHVGGIEEVGLYTAGFQIIGTYVGLIFTAMGTDYFPRLSSIAHNVKESNMLINQQAEIALLILLPILVLFIFFMPWVIKLLYSSKFLDVTDMIRWAALGMLFKAASWAVAFLLLAKGNSKLYFYNELISSIYLLLLNILGYLYYGLDGLGIAFLITYIIYFFQVFFITNNFYTFSFRPSFIRIFLLSVILVIISLLIINMTQGLIMYTFTILLIILSSGFSIWQLNKKLNLTSLLKIKK